MSYHIVQKIEINKIEKRVYVTGSDNNVYPRTPRRWHCSYYDESAQAENWKSIELDILEAYISGNFQAGRQNKYTRALEILRKNPNFKKFYWREDWDNHEKNKVEKKEEYLALLENAFKTRLPKDKFAIVKEVVRDGIKTLVYFKKRKNASFCHWYYEPKMATIFRYKEDAEVQKKYFHDSDNWQVISI